jgi:hypothetical protein
MTDEKLFRLCKAWWKMYRPVKYTEAQHLANPEINISGDKGQELARYVAELIICEHIKIYMKKE